ncbi:MAG: ATP-binding cassette domain-containing protein, partial [Ignavibacteriaceae bacterium]|nr:ATP-binding cassette domain-containing protein [Ignavibacteriaceae bacterium]
IKFGKFQMKIWTYLRRFLFTDDRLNTKVGKLSGGEKSRLTLAKILKNGGNFLLLDEPTNDLDLPTLRILEEALMAFQGCVVIVSHDRYFLNRVCNGVLAFEGNGILQFSEGNYDYYIEKKNLRLKDQSAPEEKEKKADPRVKAKAKKLSWKEQKELDSIEDDILKAEKEVDRIEQLFLLPDFYKTYALQVNQLNSELNSAKEKVSSLYERWSILEQLSRDPSS